jgi:hypothetical protein
LEENPGTRDFSHMTPPPIMTQVKSLCGHLPIWGTLPN